MHQGSAHSTHELVLAADDILPMTVYMLLHSQVANLQANAQYVTHFLPDASATSDCVPVELSHLKVHLANFIGAVEVNVSKPRVSVPFSC
jgi:hypothetical protein